MKKLHRIWRIAGLLFIVAAFAACDVKVSLTAIPETPDPALNPPPIGSSPPPPPDTPSEDREQLTFNFVNTPLSDAVRQIAQLGRVSTFVRDGVNGTITLRIGPTNGPDALQQLARAVHAVATEEYGGVFYVETQAQHAAHAKLEDPALKAKFLQLAEAHAAKADFDQAFPIRHVLGTDPETAMNPQWELSKYCARSDEDIGDRADQEIPLASSIVIYRIDYREVATAYFGHDHRLRFYFVGHRIGIDLSGPH